jgi:predicted metalloprotease
MLKTEPQKVQMPEVAGHFKTDIGRQLENVFSERGYGLYLILGLVTIVLLVLIVKMFPEEVATGSADKSPQESSGKNEESQPKSAEESEDSNKSKSE